MDLVGQRSRGGDCKGIFSLAISKENLGWCTIRILGPPMEGDE